MDIYSLRIQCTISYATMQSNSVTMCRLCVLYVTLFGGQQLRAKYPHIIPTTPPNPHICILIRHRTGDDVCGKLPTETCSLSALSCTRSARVLIRLPYTWTIYRGRSAEIASSVLCPQCSNQPSERIGLCRLLSHVLEDKFAEVGGGGGRQALSVSMLMTW